MSLAPRAGPSLSTRAHASRVARRGAPAVSRRSLLVGIASGVGTPRVLLSPDACLAREGPEFDDVVFPRYPGFVTLPSGVQIRDLCVGDGPVALPGTPLTVQWGLWTVHQGRLVVPAPLPVSSSPSAFRFVLGDGTLIPALDEAIAAGMRVGGVRRVLVPPKASTSYPYVVDDELRRNGPSTKYGRAPVSHDPSLGVQSLRAGEGPVPTDPNALDWVEVVVTRNAFTIKPTDRSLVFDLRLVDVGGGDEGTSNRATSRRARAEDQIGKVNDKSEDGGASWWTAALPTPGDYCGEGTRAAR